VGLFDNFKRLLRERFVPPAPDQWPFIRGDYIVVDPTAPVVVATGDGRLTRELAALKPPGLCMSSPLRGDVDELVSFVETVAANLAIQYLICAGTWQPKQPLGSALLELCGEAEPTGDAAGALAKNAAAKADGAHLAACRKRVKPVDMLGCTDVAKLTTTIAELAAEAKNRNTGFLAPREDADGVERLIVPRHVQLDSRPDKTGDFNIRLEGESIIVEHLNQKDHLLRVIEGKTARDICLTLIRNGWVSRLDHAAYLGRELARAEAALIRGQPFTQDSAPTEIQRTPSAAPR
jgi:tetrahydromethanopterin S-methyltransferase subunit A